MRISDWSSDVCSSDLLAFQTPADWWRALQAETDRRQGRVLLYVHGYRENFNTTSKDAAQIARMTGFDGPIIEYSWPSQGKILSYVVDETNMYHDVRNFRDFLKSLAEQQWVKEIVRSEEHTSELQSLIRTS